jgi:glucosamine--fructose-6-phosphate aminotransferase (isomerizing)
VSDSRTEGANGAPPAPQVWQDALEIPATLERTLRRVDEIGNAAALLSDGGVRRIVATGNGAAYHAAVALWLASLRSPDGAPEVVAVPVGLTANGRFRWRRGDAVLAISSSGEFRDVVELAEARDRPERFAAITTRADSALGTAAPSRVLVDVLASQSATHTQEFCGELAAALAVWAEISDDDSLREALTGTAGAARRALAEATEVPGIADFARVPEAAVVLGSGCAWAAALEAALLVKELARVPAEGMEAREAATIAITVLGPDHLVVAIDDSGDPVVEEAIAMIGRTGAAVMRLSGAHLGDERVSAITTFPAALRVAISLATKAGIDVDDPAWLDAYLSTARAADASGQFSP